ncbi:MAG: hypothetical protein B5M56_05645 [Desulfococcus sp. 4484_241]|nr:MAG: hypothetical protein B5M56_05645 [Desulfococcus sp. 4484_241]
MNNRDTDYSSLDRGDIPSLLFHPRKDNRPVPHFVNNVERFNIPVDNEIEVGAMLHRAERTDPFILFFHGNGEVVSDYMDAGSFFTGVGINLLVADYRGYGWSGGSPTVSSMMTDCHTVFSFVEDRLNKEGYTGPLIVMGRSLGSACALEIAYRHEVSIDGLIIESGFAHTLSLLRVIGADVDALGIDEDAGFGNIEKIKRYRKPLLVIHAENDHVIPFAQGVALFEECPSRVKKLVKIARADHNNIFYYGAETYMSAIKDFAAAIDSTGGDRSR